MAAKLFRGGNKVGETMTVRELIEKLREYPGDMPVFGEWERVFGFVRPEYFNVYSVGGIESLCIWVEEHY